MHWYILGPGAIGTLWASLLLQAGHRVTLLQRQPDARQQRIEIISSRGASCIEPATEALSSEGPDIEHLLVTTKAQQTEAALAQITPRLSPDAQVVLLQNGMGQHEAAARLLPSQPLWAATTTAGAWRESPTRLQLVSLGSTRIGPWDTNPMQQPDGWAALDIDLESTHNIKSVLWRKLAINCAINPLTALHHCRNGELLTDPARHETLRQVCREVDAVAEALEIKLFDTPLVEQAEAVAQSTGNNLSSMLQDIRLHRPTEIEHITGFLCRQAEHLGLSIPVNRALLEQVRNLNVPQEFPSDE